MYHRWGRDHKWKLHIQDPDNEKRCKAADYDYDYDDDDHFGYEFGTDEFLNIT